MTEAWAIDMQANAVIVHVCVRVCTVCASMRYKGPKSIYLYLRIETSHDVINTLWVGGGWVRGVL